MRTIHFHFRPHVRTLADLVREARAYAEAGMRSSRSLRPTLLAMAPRGLLAHYPERLATEEDKDLFALECRLVLVAAQATACAMVLESWMADVENGMLSDVRPSQHPLRREVVSICTETGTQHQFLTLPIVRTVLGVFVRLGENTAPAGITSGGRFANLLPKTRIRPREIRMASCVLATTGIRIATGGASPN